MASLEASSPYFSELIKVTVGEIPLQKTFNVHREVICNVSPFFEKCLNSGLSDAFSNTVKLPKDRIEIFALLLDWVYQKRVSPILDVQQAHLYYWAYVLPDKLCMEKIANEIMDVIFEHHQKYFVNCEGFTDHQGNPLPENHMRRFLVNKFARNLNEAFVGNFCKCGGGGVCHFCSFISAGGADVVTILTYQLPKLSSVPQINDEKCSYHMHKDTSVCEKPYLAKKEVTTPRKRVKVRVND